jgi:gamma-glutamyl-gamma-aminobutyrate hydrolase PuuD
MLKWIVNRHIKRIVRQGSRHTLIAFYRQMFKAAKDEYREDNDVTIQAYLREALEEGLRV